jgi:hypothetical protein
MATCVKIIPKDTSNVSEFNSTSVSKKALKKNQLLYDFISTPKFQAKRSSEALEACFTTILGDLEIDSVKKKWDSLKVGMNTSYSSAVKDYSHLVKFVELFEILLNEEERGEAEKPFVLNDFDIEEVSIDYRTAEVIHKRVMELKKQYGSFD